MLLLGPAGGLEACGLGLFDGGEPDLGIGLVDELPARRAEATRAGCSPVSTPTWADPSVLTSVPVTSAPASRETRSDRLSPYRSANTSPWDCPWSESTTMR